MRSLSFHGLSIYRIVLGSFTVYFKVNDYGAKQTGSTNNNSAPYPSNFIYSKRWVLSNFGIRFIYVNPL